MNYRNTGNPFFEHDCSSCVYLGSVVVECPDKNGREEFDLYICPKEPTVIARWSSDGPDYHSGLEFGKSAFDKLPEMAYAGCGAIAVAYAMAKIHGWKV